MDAEGSRRTVTAAEATTRVVDDAMTIFDYFSSADSVAVDLVVAALDGPHARRVNHRSTKLYYVQSGVLDITINGESQRLEIGGAAMVRPDEPHEMVGHQARVLIVSAPSLDLADEELV